MELDLETLKSVIRNIASARPDEIGCDDCLAELDRFAELELVGKSAADAFPLVADHLDRCRDCRQEYEALMEALRHMDSE